MQYFFGQFLYILARSGNLSPKEHTHLVFVVGATQLFHDFTGQMAAAAIVVVVTFVPVCFGFQSCGGCQLHGTEHTAVDIAFYFQYPLYKFGIRGQHSDTPSRHIVALAHGVEFDAALFGSRYAENTDRLFVQDKAVRVVIHDDDILAACEVYQTFVEFRSGVGSCRHIRIVGPH